jgi:hypothetical protein
VACRLKDSSTLEYGHWMSDNAQVNANAVIPSNFIESITFCSAIYPELYALLKRLFQVQFLMLNVTLAPPHSMIDEVKMHFEFAI